MEKNEYETSNYLKIQTYGNEKALELTNNTVFHRGRQWKSSRAGQQNNFFIFQPDFNVEISPKNATKHPVA